MNNSLKVLFHFGAPAGPRVGGGSLFPETAKLKRMLNPKSLSCCLQAECQPSQITVPPSGHLYLQITSSKRVAINQILDHRVYNLIIIMMSVKRGKKE